MIEDFLNQLNKTPAAKTLKKAKLEISRSVKINPV